MNIYRVFSSRGPLPLLHPSGRPPSPLEAKQGVSPHFLTAFVQQSSRGIKRPADERLGRTPPSFFSK